MKGKKHHPSLRDMAFETIKCLLRALDLLSDKPLGFFSAESEIMFSRLCPEAAKGINPVNSVNPVRMYCL